MYYFSDSPSTCWMLRRWPVGFLCLCPPMKWRTKPLLGCSKSAIVPRGILLNHTLATPFSVVGNALLITLFGVIYNSISVLNDSITIIWLQLWETEFWWKRMIQHFISVWWVCPSNHPIQILSTFVILWETSTKKCPSKKRFRYFLGHLSFWVSGMESPLIFL